MDTWRIFKTWKEYIVGTVSGNSQSFKAGYSTIGTLQMFNHPGDVIHTMTFYNIFPTDVGDVSLDGGSSNAGQIPVTFSYDYTYSDIAPNT